MPKLPPYLKSALKKVSMILGAVLIVAGFSLFFHKVAQVIPTPSAADTFLQEREDRLFEQLYDTESTYFYQPDTGHITRIVDNDGGIVFDDGGYNEADVEITSPYNWLEGIYYPYNQRPNPFALLQASVIIDGQTYQVEYGMGGFFENLRYEEMIQLYNNEVASPEMSAKLDSHSLSELLRDEAYERSLTLIEEGQLPDPVITVVSTTTVTAPAIAEAWRSGVSANEMASDDRTGYEYSFACITHAVELTNEQELIDVATAIMPGITGVYAELTNSSSITIDSEEPCGVFTNETPPGWNPGPPPAPQPLAPTPNDPA